jgi:hypothetical protein
MLQGLAPVAGTSPARRLSSQSVSQSVQETRNRLQGRITASSWPVMAGPVKQ